MYKFEYQEPTFMNHDPVTQGKAARIVRIFSLMMFRMGISHEITYWFWKILVFPGRPLFPTAEAPVESGVALPRTDPALGDRAFYVVMRNDFDRQKLFPF
jgi:hypothetical protein